MTRMVSYSHNFEDVMLRRCFADVQHGCYVDVGAGWPTKTSNTYDLYKKGWRGVIVEPLLDLIDDYEPKWRESRPDDVLVKCAAGSATGALHFFVCNQRNMSTGSTETAAYWQRQGANLGEPTPVPVRTLRAILADCLPLKNFHLLCIDVEGMEWDVISGLDLAYYRPWLMLIEATKPGSYEPNCERWEPLVLDAGYVCVYEDGSNKWYLANEHAALRDKFRYPPCVWDNFIGWREAELEEKLQQFEKHAGEPRYGQQAVASHK